MENTPVLPYSVDENAPSTSLPSSSLMAAAAMPGALPVGLSRPKRSRSRTQSAPPHLLEIGNQLAQEDRDHGPSIRLPEEYPVAAQDENQAKRELKQPMLSETERTFASDDPVFELGNGRERDMLATDQLYHTSAIPVVVTPVIGRHRRLRSLSALMAGDQDTRRHTLRAGTMPSLSSEDTPSRPTSVSDGLLLSPLFETYNNSNLLPSASLEPLISRPPSDPRRRRKWILKWGLVLLILAGLGVGLYFLWPILSNKVIIPALDWVDHHLPNWAIALIILGSLTFLPALMMPSAPLLWLAGVVFRYWPGFALVTAGVLMGMTVPFFIGQKFLRHRVRGWLDRKKKIAFLIRSAERQHPFKWVMLLRLADMPYTVVNYLFSTTSIPFKTYIVASLVGQSPHNFASLYIGITLKDLAEASKHGHKLSKVTIVEIVLGAVAVVLVIVGGALWARQTLRKMEMEERTLEEHRRLQQDGDEGTIDVVSTTEPRTMELSPLPVDEQGHIDLVVTTPGAVPDVGGQIPTSPPVRARTPRTPSRLQPTRSLQSQNSRNLELLEV
eukprot:jgi/Chlat1/277/Chrsp1S03055